MLEVLPSPIRFIILFVSYEVLTEAKEEEDNTDNILVKGSSCRWERDMTDGGRRCRLVCQWKTSSEVSDAKQTHLWDDCEEDSNDIEQARSNDNRARDSPCSGSREEEMQKRPEHKSKLQKGPSFEENETDTLSSNYDRLAVSDKFGGQNSTCKELPKIKGQYKQDAEDLNERCAKKTDRHLDGSGCPCRNGVSSKCSYCSFSSSIPATRNPLSSPCLACLTCIAIAFKVNETLTRYVYEKEKGFRPEMDLRASCCRLQRHKLKSSQIGWIVTDEEFEAVPVQIDMEAELKKKCMDMVSLFDADSLYEKWIFFRKNSILRYLCRDVMGATRDCLGVIPATFNGTTGLDNSRRGVTLARWNDALLFLRGLDFPPSSKYPCSP